MPTNDGIEREAAAAGRVCWPLIPLSLLYASAVRIRNLYYGHVPGATRAAGVRVISVGNLTVGGTGKTPLVIEIVRRLLAGGRRPAIVTRGYAAATGETADEVLEFRDAVPEAPVVVSRDRVAGAAAAQREHGANCVVLDDGFQHRRLRRDLDIVLIDALNPWGGGWVLPAGRLRESLAALRRADVVVITRASQTSAGVPERIAERVRRYARRAFLFQANTEVERLVGLDGGTVDPVALARHRVLAVCGVGNPASFVRLVAGLTSVSTPHMVFADHHRYVASDVARILAAAQRAAVDAVVTTRKDWVKLAPLWRSVAGDAAQPPLWRLDIRTGVADPGRILDRLLLGEVTTPNP